MRGERLCVRVAVAVISAATASASALLDDCEPKGNKADDTNEGGGGGTALAFAIVA